MVTWGPADHCYWLQLLKQETACSLPQHCFQLLFTSTVVRTVCTPGLTTLRHCKSQGTPLPPHPYGGPLCPNAHLEHQHSGAGGWRLEAAGFHRCHKLLCLSHQTHSPNQKLPEIPAADWILELPLTIINPRIMNGP